MSLSIVAIRDLLGTVVVQNDLDGAGEDELRGREAGLGGVRLRFGLPISRCVMTTRPQPGGIARARSRVALNAKAGGYSVSCTEPSGTLTR